MAEIGEDSVRIAAPTAADVPARAAQRKDRIMRSPLPVGVRRVVIPLDGSSFAEQALGVGVTVAVAFGAEMLLTRCYSERSYLPSGSAALLSSVAEGNAGGRRADMPVFTHHQLPLNDALAYLKHVCAAVARPGLTVYTRAVEWPPSFAIVQLADRPRSDLVVMAANLGAVGIQHNACGLVTREVIEHIAPAVPLLLVQGDWASDALSTSARESDVERTTPLVAVVRTSGGARGAGDTHELAREYATLFAHVFASELADVTLPPEMAHPDVPEGMAAPTGERAAPNPVALYVVGGQRRAPMAIVAERLLRSARVPVLLVPEA